MLEHEIGNSRSSKTGIFNGLVGLENRQFTATNLDKNSVINQRTLEGNNGSSGQTRHTKNPIKRYIQPTDNINIPQERRATAPATQSTQHDAHYGKRPGMITRHADTKTTRPASMTASNENEQRASRERTPQGNSPTPRQPCRRTGRITKRSKTGSGTARGTRRRRSKQTPHSDGLTAWDADHARRRQDKPSKQRDKAPTPYRRREQAPDGRDDDNGQEKKTSRRQRRDGDRTSRPHQASKGRPARPPRPAIREAGRIPTMTRRAIAFANRHKNRAETAREARALSEEREQCMTKMRD